MGQLTSMLEQVRKLKNGVGVQSLLEEAYKILGNPIAVLSTEYNLLAYTDVTTDDPIWNELITCGALSRETLTFIENEGFIEELANSPRSALLKSKKIKYDRMMGKLFNRDNSNIFNLGTVACNKPFEEYDQIVFEAICKLISKEINSSELYQAYEQPHKEAIIKKLMDGTYDKKLDIVQIGSIYDSLKSNLFLVVVDTSLCSSESFDAAHFRDLFKQICPAYKYVLYSDYIIIIISTNDDILPVTKELHALIEIFQQNNMYAGISGRFENLFELQKYYAQALNAMHYALETRSSQRIFPCHASSMDKMDQINALENGLGIQYFLNEAFKIFGNPVLFHDMELNLLGYTENAEIFDPVLQELITYGTASDETIELFRSEGMIDLMDNIKGGALLLSDKFKYDRISWRIYNSDNIRIGCTSIANSDAPFSEDELVFFGTFSQKFSKEVAKIEFYNNYGQVYSGTIINRLISGKIDDYTFYTEDIGNLYDDFMENLYLVAVDTTQCCSEQVNLTYFRKLFSHMGTMNRYAFYAKYIIIIMSMDGALLNENHELDKLNEIFEQNDIYAGISSCFDDVYQLPRYYKEAVDALHAGMRKKGKNGKHWIFRCDG